MTKTGSFPKPLLVGLIVVAVGIVSYTGYRIYNWKKDHVLVELRPIQTDKGWGYDILADGKLYMHQTNIPAISGNYGFRTKEDALAVGRKVYERVMAGDIPMVTPEEVREMGVVPDSTHK